MFRDNKQQSTRWGQQPETAMAMAMALRLIISLQIFVAALSLVDSGWWASSFSLCFCSILQQKFFVLRLTFLLHFLNCNNKIISFINSRFHVIVLTILTCLCMYCRYFQFVGYRILQIREENHLATFVGSVRRS